MKKNEEDCVLEIITCTITNTTDTTPGVLSGTGTLGDPYLIESIEDLVALSNIVNGGTTYSGKYISLTIGLDFSNKQSYVNSNTTVFGDINGNGIVEGLMTELTTESGFLPIGNNSKKFHGNLLGNENCIKNFYINRSSSDYVGLFGYNNGTIDNFKFSHSNVSGKEYISVISGINNGTIKNITMSNSKTFGVDSTGLIAGDNYGTITGININDSTVIGKNNAIGGVAGYSNNIINGVVVNNINVSGTIHTGGVVGFTIYGNLSNVVVSGTVTSDDNTGLVAGYNGATITSVIADGNVIGVNNTGGLVGINYETVKGINRGVNIIATGNKVGRVVGNNIYSVNVLSLNTVTINDLTITHSYATNGHGADITSIDLLNPTTYTNIGFNFTDETKNYIWYIEDGVAKFRKGSLQ